jgi:hypothetical protein
MKRIGGRKEKQDRKEGESIRDQNIRGHNEKEHSKICM